MSTNYLYNGSFTLPTITTNSYVYANTLSASDISSFYWTNTNQLNYVSIHNGTNTFYYPDPSLISQTQFCALQYTSNIQQSFSALVGGTYQLSFYYGARASGYPINNLQVYINGVLLTTITTAPSPLTSWGYYVNNLSPINLGVNTLLFQGTNNSTDTDIAIASVQVLYIPPPGGGTPTTYNSFKSTNVYGYLNVSDYIPTGGALVQGQITTQRNYNYSYTIVPTLSSNALGYSIAYTASTISMTANSYSNSSAQSIPTGIYLVFAKVSRLPIQAKGG